MVIAFLDLQIMVEAVVGGAGGDGANSMVVLY